MDKIKNEDDTYENELNNQKIKECACETEGKECSCNGECGCDCIGQDLSEVSDKTWIDQSINVKGQRQIFECQIKTQKDDNGIFEGYASTFGNMDKVKLLYQHNTNEPIGVFNAMKEDKNGLLVEGQLAMGTQRGRETYELMKMGALDAMSIGFKADPRNQSYDEKRRRRYLKDIDLMEVSLVTFPMNDKAVIHAVKGADRTVREWEDLLRDAGDLSRTQAKMGAKALVDALEQREVAEDFGGLLESVEKIKKVLTTNH